MVEKRQRVILYGDSLILETVGASLQKHLQFEVISLSDPYPSARQLGAMQPDVILFDMDPPRPEAAFSLLATCPGLQLIGINPETHQALVWSGRQAAAAAAADLVDVIRRGRRGDTGNGRRSLRAVNGKR